MRPILPEAFATAAAPRHARLFELIRQDNLWHRTGMAEPAGPEPMVALDTFRTLACRSLMRRR